MHPARGSIERRPEPFPVADVSHFSMPPARLSLSHGAVLSGAVTEYQPGGKAVVFDRDSRLTGGEVVPGFPVRVLDILAI